MIPLQSVTPWSQSLPRWYVKVTRIYCAILVVKVRFRLIESATAYPREDL